MFAFALIITNFEYSEAKKFIMKINAINIDPEIMGGTPVFMGTRVPVESLFQWLETETLKEFLENFPGVSKEQVKEVLEAAGKLITSEKILHEDFIG